MERSWGGPALRQRSWAEASPCSRGSPVSPSTVSERGPAGGPGLWLGLSSEERRTGPSRAGDGRLSTCSRSFTRLLRASRPASGGCCRRQAVGRETQCHSRAVYTARCWAAPEGAVEVPPTHSLPDDETEAETTQVTYLKSSQWGAQQGLALGTTTWARLYPLPSAASSLNPCPCPTQAWSWAPCLLGAPSWPDSS